MKKHIGKIVVAVLTLAVIAGAFYACLRIANDKSQARDNVFSANLKAVTYTVDKSNAKLVKEMAKWQTQLEQVKTTVSTAANEVLEQGKKVTDLRNDVDLLKASSTGLNDKVTDLYNWRAEVDKKLAKPAVAETKPSIKAKTPVVKKPAKVVAKKSVKKVVVKKTAVKKPAKVVKAKSVKLDAGAKTVITVGPNKGGQMEVTLDIFK